MVHLAIDGMWQVFLLQRSTPRNSFCRIAAKNGILLRLVNTLHSLNEATRLASIANGVGSFQADGAAQRPRSGPLDSSHLTFMQGEAPVSASDHVDLGKNRHGAIDQSRSVGTLEPARASASYSQFSENHMDSRYFAGDSDKSQPSHTAMEASRSPEPACLDNGRVTLTEEATTSKDWEQFELRKPDPSRPEVDIPRQQRLSSSNTRTSTDKPLKQMELTSNGFGNTGGSQQEHVRPLLSLLDKEPPSRHFSGQLEYVKHFSGLERHESILPLLHASAERRTNGELDFLMAEFEGDLYCCLFTSLPSRYCRKIIL